jgi:NodT family efflux transporter outer membrane factor (OMF) lipoprotein
MSSIDSSRAPAVRNALFYVAISAALTACTLGPDFHSPAAPATDHYTQGAQPQATTQAPGPAGGAQTFTVDRDIPGDWWTLFQSGPLDELVRAALSDSPTVAAARATLRSAQENYLAQRGNLLFPAVDGGFSGTRQKTAGAAFGAPQFGSSEFTLVSASVNVSYRLDFFGASRRQLEALRAQTDHQRWELEAANLSLTGNVVTTAIDIASLRAQIDAANEIIASQQEQLLVVQKQFAAGGVSHSDVLTQATQLAQTQATLPALEKALAQAQHRLAVLAGKTPDTDTPVFDLRQLQLPTDLPVSVPAKLIRQRPDVQAAEATLHQATAQVGVATADLFPQINLSGSIGSDALRASQLFTGGTGTWNIGAALTQPIFHGGELLHKRRAALADLDGAAAQYRQTVLAAMQDVADTLRALEADARDLRAQAAAADAASRSLEITKKQYAAGGVSHVQLLVAERAYAEARQSLVLAEASRFADSAALYQALGGGWWNRSTQQSPDNKVSKQ